MTRAVFLDRDGVLNRAVVRDGKPFPPATVDEVEVLPGVAEACRRLADAGWLLIVVTNQPDLARGNAVRAEVDAINDAVTAGLPIADVRVCPHDDADACSCRKPRPGLLLAAAEHWGIDLAASAIVGDRWRDIEAGEAAGVRTLFIDYDYDEAGPTAPDHVVADLAAAADVLLAAPSPGGADADDWDGHWSVYADANRDNPAQEYRRHLIITAIERTGAPARLLDIGSGQGALLASLADRWPDAELAGLELSHEGIRLAAPKVPTAKLVQIDLMTATDVPDDLVGWADVAVCSEVLEHVDDPARLLRNAVRCLAPGGQLVVTVPGGPRTAFDKSIGHRRHFRPSALRAVLDDAGLSIERVRGNGFPFFNLYKFLVLLRGEAIARDASADAPPSMVTRAATRIFGVLLRERWNLSRAGWQLTAEARRP